MEYVYARVSTDEQDTQNQLHQLKQKYPEAEVITETVSGYKDKPALNALLARLSPGDVLVVSALDRLGRHAQKALLLIEELLQRGIKVVSIREGINTATSTGKFVATLMFGLAEMERNLISERTKNTMARLKAEGRPYTRPKKYGDSEIEVIKAYRRQGMIIRDISALTGISTGRVCQLLKA